MNRRTFAGTAAALLAVRPVFAQGLDERFAAIESRTGGRLGVAVLDVSATLQYEYRSKERFPMCSTFKFLAVADVLTRADGGSLRLEQRIPYGKADLLEYAPVTSQFVRRGWMTLAALCEATTVYSDNTAANLLLKRIGGPAGVTNYARSLGDEETRLDRTEPSLNTCIPGDVRDTTTPAVMAWNLHRVLLGNALSAPSRKLFITWLRACRTSPTLLRAGFPKTWPIGDKSGMGMRHNATGDSDTRNDIAIVWPKNALPFTVATYLTEVKVGQRERDAALAAVARTVTKPRA